MTNLLVIAASARAAAFSALRGGFTPICCDLFGDADLARVCTADTIASYPRGFVDWAQTAPTGPILYGGALENHPRVIAELALQREIWGNRPDVLRAIRSSLSVAACLRDAGLATPRVVLEPPRHGAWLVKPLASAGGRGISFWKPGQALPARRPVYFQEFVEGAPCAALYVANAGRASLLGVTRQLIGEPWLHAAPFQYCGSVGPIVLATTAQQQFERLGNALAQSFGLRGLFGIDCILLDGTPWPVEVNPRYTASVEVLEWALGLAAIRMHCRVFDPSVPTVQGKCESVAPYVGKAILFARRDCVIPADAPWQSSLDRSPAQWHDYADLPHQGQSIAAGHPIVTLFARAQSDAECLLQLQQAARSLDQHLFGR
jgi:uncharacterized protein